MSDYTIEWHDHRPAPGTCFCWLCDARDQYGIMGYAVEPIPQIRRLRAIEEAARVMAAHHCSSQDCPPRLALRAALEAS